MNISKAEFENYPTVDYVLSEYLYKYKIHLDKCVEKYNYDSYKVLYYNIHLFDKFLYLKYKDSDFEIKDLKEKDIEEFLEFCGKVMKNQPITLNSKLVSIRLLMKYICKYHKGIFKYNISLQVPKIKMEQTPPEYIKYSDINLILSKLRENNYGIREVCICKIIMTCGIKVTEVFKLKMSNIDMENKFLNILINNEKASYPIVDTLYTDLKDYLSLRSTIKTNSEYLFLNNFGTPKTIRSFQMAFRKAVIDCNLPKAYTAQNLRGSFMYAMGDVVEDEMELQDITGQKNVKQYIKIKENPLNNIK